MIVAQSIGVANFASSGGGNAVRATEFTGSGDFTMAATTQLVRVILIGAGGGGGSGGTSGAGVVCSGGAGGGGAGKRELVLTRADVLAAYPTGIVPIGIGAGGTAGATCPAPHGAPRRVQRTSRSGA